MTILNSVVYTNSNPYALLGIDGTNFIIPYIDT